MIVDFRKSTVPPPPPSVMDSPITSVESFRFLGTTITQDLKWEPTISSLIKKAQQRMYFLRQLRKAKLPAQMLVQFYTAIIESILTSSITVWFAGATVRDKQRLQRIVRSAEEVIGRSLPSLQDLSRLCLCPVSTEAFDLVLRHGRNSTVSLLRSEFPALGSSVHSLVGQLYMDMSLYILGSDSSVNHMVGVLYSRLFPLAYRRLLGGAAPSSVSEDCLKGAWKDSGAFGPYPKLLMTRLSRSLLATRVFLQALNLGIEVVNTTDHLRPGRDCSRSLLRLWFCPHCHGQLEPVACKGLCQAVMQGCLGGAVEVQPHWRTYVEGLGKLALGMRGEQDMEAVVLRLPSIIKLSLKHVLNAKTRITALMSGMCSQGPKRSTRSVGLPSLPHPASVSRPAHPPSLAPEHDPSAGDPDETLTGLRREFISSLRGFIPFYSGLGEALCSREPPTANSSLCWNGHEMTDRRDDAVERRMS
uniref:Glypican-3 n=1 Tax=Knipowitschia caucasica TaxID=637954 RepID=A0AAV2MLR0_KNICA